MSARPFARCASACRFDASRTCSAYRRKLSEIVANRTESIRVGRIVIVPGLCHDKCNLFLCRRLQCLDQRHRVILGVSQWIGNQTTWPRSFLSSRAGLVRSQLPGLLKKRQSAGHTTLSYTLKRNSTTSPSCITSPCPPGVPVPFHGLPPSSRSHKGLRKILFPP
jgi:hypothetical protein